MSARTALALIAALLAALTTWAYRANRGPFRTLPITTIYGNHQ